MTRVYVVSTVHEENGLVTHSALLNILQSVRPEVIFLEIPSASFPAYDQGFRSNLETSAARRYREATGVALVPVDLPTPEESFFRNWQYMDRRIAATSPIYCQLIDQNTYDVAKHGFSYLNSEQCRDTWSAIYKTMEVAIQRLSHDTQLLAIYDDLRRSNGLRDLAMLNGIDAYFSQKPFTTGVLLVGAAHADSIVKRSREGRQASAPAIVSWDAGLPA